MMNTKIITVACIENSSLYVASLTNWSPGWASSARTTSTISPAMKKKTNELIRYMIPIFLWSVVVSQAYRPLR
jgi:hypothetical protein